MFLSRGNEVTKVKRAAIYLLKRLITLIPIMIYTWLYLIPAPEIIERNGNEAIWGLLIILIPFTLLSYALATFTDLLK